MPREKIRETRKNKRPQTHNARRAADLGLTVSRPPVPKIAVKPANNACPSYALLPQDVLSMIFDHFGDYALVTILSLVCKRWRSLVLKLKRTLAVSLVQPEAFTILPCLTEVTISKPTPYAHLVPPTLRKLVITGNEHIRLGRGACVCSSFVKLTHFALDSLVLDYTRQCSCYLQLTKQHQHTLTSLDIVVGDYAGLDGLHLPKLQYLSLSGAETAHKNAFGVATVFIGTHASQLLSLVIAPKSTYTRDRLPNEFYTLSFPTLTHLHVGHVRDPDWGKLATLLQSVPYLTSLTLGISRSVDFPRNFDQFARVLVEFDYDGDYSRDADLSAHIAPCTRLTALSIRNARALNVESLLLPHVSRLEKLEIHEGSFTCAIHKWFCMLANCVRLEELKLHLSEPLSPVTVSQYSLPSLRRFQLFYTTVRIDPSLKAIVNLLEALLASAPRLQAITTFLPRTTTRKHTTKLSDFLEKAEADGLESIHFQCRRVSLSALRLMQPKFGWLKVAYECPEGEEDSSLHEGRHLASDEDLGEESESQEALHMSFSSEEDD